MIAFESAYQLVMETAGDFGNVVVPLAKADGRVLAENVLADRDFPPFDRATKDGIAIQYDENYPLKIYPIEGIAAAGAPQKKLVSEDNCFEIMTGAILPTNTNTVVMYEHLEIKDGIVKVTHPIRVGQNIHYQGSDEQKNQVVLKEGTLITAAEIGVLASVGKSEVLVKRNPKITIFSTGDELVPVEETPKPHQIRQSNSHTLRAALLEVGIASDIIHVTDNKDTIKTALLGALEKSDILLLSGGVSKGKYDYLPELFEELRVQKRFHKVLQRPGKPFWFGIHPDTRTTIFGFPGNPTSTFVNYNVYFMPWLHRCFGQNTPEIQVSLEESFENTTDLTRFVRTKMLVENGVLKGKIIEGNGSGDLTSLTSANGFIKVLPGQKIKVGTLVPFIVTRRIL